MTDRDTPEATPGEVFERQEGDINTSAARRDWQGAHLSDEARALLEEDSRYFIHQSLSTPCLNVLKSCDNATLTDWDGKVYLDFHGNCAHQVGFANPRVIAALKRQLDTLSFCPRRYTNEPAIELAKRLTGLAPGDLDRVLFAPSGAAAIGIALKLARVATGRFKTISWWGAFHGGSLDTVSIGGEAMFRSGMGPLLPGAVHVPPPADEEGRGGDKLGPLADADYVEYVMEHEGDIAAFIAEPIRCTQVIRPAQRYWKRIRELCDKHGALLVFDEIPLCLGRTGKLFAFEHTGVLPDMVALGKGLGGGIMPMAAVIAREHLNVGARHSLGHFTHEKSPMGCAAALATLDCIEEEGLVARAAALGAFALDALKALEKKHGCVVQARGVGLVLALELGDDDANYRPAWQVAERVLYASLERGLSFKVSGGNVLTLTPPLTIAEDELARAIRILDEAITQAVA